MTFDNPYPDLSTSASPRRIQTSVYNMIPKLAKLTSVSANPGRFVKLFFFTLLAFNLIFLLYNENGLNHSINKSIKSISSNINVNLSPLKLGSKNTLSIQRMPKHVRNKFKSLKDPQNADRFFMINTDLTEVDITIPVNYTTQTYSSNIITYDPRFTLSMYLHELKVQYLANARTVDLNEISQPIKLPFDWVDWMDLTLLNEQLREPPEVRPNCQSIRENTDAKQVLMERWCQDLDQVTEEQLQTWGYTKQQLPGFIIFGHQPHNKRCFNDDRVKMAKSYALIHMPNPLKVIILDQDGTYEFDVDQTRKQRINQGDMFQRYLKFNNLLNDEVEQIKLNHLEELRHLKSLIIPYNNEDTKLKIEGSSMYNLSQEMFHPKTIDEQFAYLPKEFLTSLDSLTSEGTETQEQQAKLDSLIKSQLTPQQQIFLDGLLTCQASFDNQEPRFFKMTTLRLDDERNVDYDRGWHYDWRFFNGALNYDKPGWTQQENTFRTEIILDRLLRNWTKFAQKKGIIWWIMHGPLLSWYWDGLMFPFDIDIDIQVPVEHLYTLARDYNQTLVVEDPSEGYGKFFIEAGTYIYNRDMSNGENYIDARFIDVDSGIYIDITGLSKSKAMPDEFYTEEEIKGLIKDVDINKVSEFDEIYNDRRKHFYKLHQISPLRHSMLQGIPVFIPQEINSRLQFEYERGLSEFEYADWYFVKQLNLWIHGEHLSQVLPHELIMDEPGKINKEKVLIQLDLLTDEIVLKLLDIDEILIEYYKTKKYTDFHDLEMEYMLVGDHKRYEELVEGYFKKMDPPLRKALWDYENLERPKHHKNR